MEATETVIYILVALIVGSLVLWFLGGIGEGTLFTKVKASFSSDENAHYEQLTFDDLPAAVLGLWDACGRGSQSLNKTIYVTSEGTYTKAALFEAFRRAQVCSSIQSTEHACGAQEDVIFGGIEGPVLLALECRDDGMLFISPEPCSQSACRATDAVEDDCRIPACAGASCVQDIADAPDATPCIVDGGPGTCDDGACVPCEDLRDDTELCGARVCGAVEDACGIERDCGTCAIGVCTAAGLCVCTDTCASLGYTCGAPVVCGATKNCGTCAVGTCNATTYTCDPPVCGDHWCEQGETAASCAQDCGYSNGMCGQQFPNVPPALAATACDAFSPYNENVASCPGDCPAAKCGNRVCDAGEYLRAVAASQPCAADCMEQSAGLGLHMSPNRTACLASGGFWKIPEFIGIFGLPHWVNAAHASCCPSNDQCPERENGPAAGRWVEPVGARTMQELVCYEHGSSWTPGSNRYTCSSGKWIFRP